MLTYILGVIIGSIVTSIIFLSETTGEIRITNIDGEEHIMLFMDSIKHLDKLHKRNHIRFKVSRK